MPILFVSTQIMGARWLNLAGVFSREMEEPGNEEALTTGQKVLQKHPFRTKEDKYFCPDIAYKIFVLNVPA